MLSLTFALLISFSLANAASVLPYISNGREARITEFPYLVSIQEVVVHVCAGSLLSERWVLSSARCFNNRILNELNIEYGNSEITPGPNGPNKVGISRIIRHEEYDSVSVVNDISLVEAETAIVTGFHDSFAKLAPGGSRFGSGVHSVHAGWGYIGSNQRTTSLQKASLKTLSFDECVLASADTQQPVRTNICAKAESVICLTDLGTNSCNHFFFCRYNSICYR